MQAMFLVGLETGKFANQQKTPSNNDFGDYICYAEGKETAPDFNLQHQERWDNQKKFCFELKKSIFAICDDINRMAN